MGGGHPGSSLGEGIEIRRTVVLGVPFLIGAVNASQAVPICQSRLYFVCDPLDMAHRADAEQGNARAEVDSRTTPV